MSPQNGHARLRKDLGLFDVYAISTGAMFSSGFFLLPGLAAAQTGPSVPLAYLAASLFIVPAMLSVAELASAMPRAGGAYYFLDRSLGPMVGTVGGLGTWMALVLKSAFALVGMGAYLALFMDVPVRPLAVALTVVFTVINIVGAKETSGLQRVLVTALIAILAIFIVQGLIGITSGGVRAESASTPLFTHGVNGFLGTIGFVFVSYAGLTKVASVSEEVRDPDRNIPLGMMLSLATATFVYVVGVFILVAVIPASELNNDLTPVATAARELFGWLPGDTGVVLITVAAIAAFASTGNAGVLSASRYPLAMARDRLVSPHFAKLGRFQTPTLGIVVTALLMIASITLLDVEGIAKLASAFQLLLFSALSLAVIVMRESGVQGYDPGYRSPFYPWMHLVGFLAPFWLITEMGQVAILFTLGLVTATIGWYFYYANPRVEREGAIFHTFARLGARRHVGLDLELRAIVKEKGLREGDPFDEVVANATVLEFEDDISLVDLVEQASQRLEGATGVAASTLRAAFRGALESGLTPLAHGAAIPHLTLRGLSRPTILLARCRCGVRHVDGADPQVASAYAAVCAVFFLVSPQEKPAQHLRLLGHLATHIDDPDFLRRWMEASGPAEVKATLLREERWITVRVGREASTREWVGRPLRSIVLPAGTLVALIRRAGEGIVPDGSSVLEEGDQLVIIGGPEGIRIVAEQFGPL